MTGNIPQEESRTVAPIYTLKADDLNGTDEEVSERLLINPHDVSALRDYYNEAITVDTLTADEEKVVVLFRFATSDYYCDFRLLFCGGRYNRTGQGLFMERQAHERASLSRMGERIFGL